MRPWHILADDLTGALDSAAAWAGAGDTVFIKLRAAQFDAVVAMYHDQGHIPVKLLGFAIEYAMKLVEGRRPAPPRC